MERAEAEAIYDSGRETVIAVLLRMDEQIQQLTARVAKQGERIAELERRLNRSSRNSSVPPSQDPPNAPQRKRPDPSGRPQGAQLGHPGKGRKLLPVEAVDRVVDHWPRRCGCLFRNKDGVRGAEPVSSPRRIAEPPPPPTGLQT